MNTPAEQTSPLSSVTSSDEILAVDESHAVDSDPLTICKVVLTLRGELPPLPPLSAGSVWSLLQLVLSPVSHLSTTEEHRD